MADLDGAGHSVVSERDLLGEVLPGYELAEEIGRGGWGVVYEATHRTLKRRAAVKLLPAAFSADPAARDRFRSEARVVASLDHPHIVPLYDFVEQGDTCVFVMELMPGGTLWDRFSGGELTPEEACNVTLALLGALHHAHERGVLHRDVKPENVLFNTEGLPKLADFGIAKVLGDNAGTRTATGMIMGTPAYMAPEQGSGDPVSPATDVYAIGAMLYELLSGRLPFESTGNALAQLYRHVHEPPTPLADVAPVVPAGVASVVMKALEKSPGDRYADAATFASELNLHATGAFGEDWPARTNIPVLATRAVLGRTIGRPQTGRHDGTGGTDAGAPVAPAQIYPPPAPPVGGGVTGQPTATSGQPAAGPAGGGEPQRPPDAAPKRSRRGLLLGAGLVVAAAAAAVGVLLTGDDPEGENIPAAAIVRFQDACRSNGVDDDLCTCALERSMDELTPAQFLENDALVQETGGDLTSEVNQRFLDCQEQIG